MDTVRENIDYKTLDHLFRSNDEYAQGKYDITTRWLKPSIKPGQLLLNIGCGSGDYNTTAHEMGLRVVACEPEGHAYELAIKHAPKKDCQVLKCGLMELQKFEGTADYIVMHDVLEHIENDSLAVKTVHSLLKPGGTAVISVPAMQWLFGHHDVQLGHFRRYTKASLLPLFTKGFKTEAIRYYGAAFIPVALWFSKLARKEYPKPEAGQGLTQRAMRWVCQAESRFAPPVGTSVLICVRKEL